jgi:glycosyltransferase involved in cell wall biosynthesis
MTRALFIAYYFPPVGGAGVQRVQKFVRYLGADGILPIVVAGPGSAEGQWTPHDATLLTDIPPTVQVHRVRGPMPGTPTRWERRVQTLTGLPGSFSKWWVNSATKLALDAAADVSFIFATMPPFESAEVADAVSRSLGIPWVADLRDPWVVDEIQVYPTRLHRQRELLKMEGLLARAALIIMNTPTAARALKRALPRLAKKPIISICNGFDKEDFEGTLAPREDQKFRIVHAGSLLTELGLQFRAQKMHRFLGGARKNVDILTRSPLILLEALSRWSKNRVDVQTDVEIVFAGKATSSDQALVKNSVVNPLVRFTGYLAHSESLRLVRTADLLFLPMHNLPKGERATTIPGKAYEYMASGRPILAAVPDGDARDFLNQCGTALICRPDDVDSMIENIERIYDAWKNRGANLQPNLAFVNQFERRALTRALASAFRAHLGASTGNLSDPIVEDAPTVIRT